MERYSARLIGVIEGCTNPESAELLPDGETIVFGNCTLMVGIPEYQAGRGVVYVEDAAFVSKGRISRTGEVSLLERELITGLTATLGCDILPVPTEKFAAGTVFHVNGGRPITADKKTLTKSATPSVLAYDGYSGEVLGRIPVDDDSALAARWNGVDQPNGCAIDAAGNLYFTDIPNSNPDPDPAAPPPVPPAVYRIPHESIDALSENDPAAGQTVQRVYMPGYVNGVTISPLDDVAWAVSCSLADPHRGGIYRLDEHAFATSEQPPPFKRDLGILDGVGVTRRGTVLASNPLTGEIFAYGTDGSECIVEITDYPVPVPADFNVVYPVALDGEPALLVPNVAVGWEPQTSFVVVCDISGM